MIRVALAHRDLHQVTRGGICTLYKSLAGQLAARGASVTLITQRSPHPVRISGVTTVSLPRTENLTQHRNAVALAIDRARPDVVDCSTWEAETLHYLVRPRTRRAPVLVRGEFSAARLGAWRLARDEQRLVHAADKVIAVSDYAARDLTREYGIALPPVVANGVDRTTFRPGPASAPASGYRITLDGLGQPVSRTPVSSLLAGDEPLMPWDRGVTGLPRLVWVGKITPMKGWDTLEAAVRRLRGVATVSVLLGHSRALAPVTIDSRHDLTVLQDLDDQDMPSFYRAADWLLSTSRWEGFGLAIAEALACGTPVLLPESLGTAPELLVAGAGRTYRDVDHLAAIVSRPDRPEGCLPRRYDWAHNAAQTLDLYRTLISGLDRCGS